MVPRAKCWPLGSLLSLRSSSRSMSMSQARSMRACRMSRARLLKLMSGSYSASHAGKPRRGRGRRPGRSLAQTSHEAKPLGSSHTSRSAMLRPARTRQERRTSRRSHEDRQSESAPPHGVPPRNPTLGAPLKGFPCTCPRRPAGFPLFSCFRDGRAKPTSLGPGATLVPYLPLFALTQSQTLGRRWASLRHPRSWPACAHTPDSAQCA